jgi:hypothetical protein
MAESLVNVWNSPLQAAKMWSLQMLQQVYQSCKVPVFKTLSAKLFYDAYYHRQPRLDWPAFWSGFAETILAEGVSPNPFLEQEIQKLCDDRLGFVPSSALDSLFEVWDCLDTRDPLVKEAQFEHDLKLLHDAGQQPYHRTLVLKVVSAIEAFISDLRPNDLVSISSKGLLNTKRRPLDGTTRFGVQRGRVNDVNLDDEDLHLFQILSNSDGYYIVDAANLGSVCLKVDPRRPFPLKKGTNFKLGRDICLTVTDCFVANPHIEPDDLYGFQQTSPSAPRIELQVTMGEHQGAKFSLVSAESSEFTIGNSLSADHNFIEFADSAVSRRQAKVAYIEDRWVLVDLESTYGTWVTVMNCEDSAYKVPSKPIRLTTGDIFEARKYRFEVLQA